jgi:hypothetical protein
MKKETINKKKDKGLYKQQYLPTCWRESSPDLR